MATFTYKITAGYAAAQNTLISVSLVTWSGRKRKSCSVER